MVFARTKLLIQDNCFEEEPGELEIKYVGPNPQELYKQTYEAMKEVFRVADSDIQEETFNWGKGKTEKFKVTWYLHKNMDQFTHLYIRIKIIGEGDTGTGGATITMKPMIRTEYPQDTLWQKSLFYEMMRTFWHRVFYHRQRFEYAEECRHLTILFRKNLQELFREVRERYG
jgi:hypothetical protein